MTRRGWLPSRRAKHTFVGLFAGVMLLAVAGVFTLSLFEAVFTSQQPKTVARSFVRTVQLSQQLSDIKKGRRWLYGSGYRVTLSQWPNPQYVTVTQFQSKKLYALFYQHYPQLKFQWRTDNGQWLLVTGRLISRPYVVTGFVVMILALVMGLVFLLSWALRRVSVPLDAFLLATQRFACDVQAAPIAEEGNDDVVKLARSFNQMQAKIRRLLMDRTQMLAAISHDLRTPITRLQLRAEYLQGTEQYDKALRDIAEIEQMISSILAFSKDHTANEVVEAFDLNVLLESICHDMTDSGKDVDYDEADEVVHYAGKTNALRRVFNNIIDNAVKYGSQARVSLSAEASSWVVRVKDRGPGIPEAELENVFTPFYRVDAARNPELVGSGLGLAVARDIVRAHGGDIACRNLTDEPGLVVLVRLPMNTSEDG